MTDRLLPSPSLEQYGVVSPITTVLINRPYEASHGEKVPLLSFSTEPPPYRDAGEPDVVSRSSISQLRASPGARAPSESFIILSAVAPSALINARPGVLASEAEAAFFKTALLIDGAVLGGTHSSRSKCLHSPFLFSASFTRPPGHSFLECAAASQSYTQPSARLGFPAE